MAIEGVTTAPLRTLITGGSGFIGSRLIPALSATQQVRVLARRPLPFAVSDDVEVSYAEGLEDSTALRRVMQKANVVIHLASVVHRNGATTEEFTNVNVRGTQRVAEEAAEAGVSHFILLSSIAAVGTGDGRAIDEHTAPNPITPYGVSKLRAEDELFRVAERTSMIASALRPPMVYGPGMKGNPLRLFRALDRHIPLPLAGARNHRSSIFVDNLVAGICCLASRTGMRGGIYNIADREVVSTEAFTRASANALGVRAWLLPSPYALLRIGGRVSDRFPFVARLGLTSAFAESIGGSLVLDTSRLERETGFVPPYSQADGLAATAHWFRSSRR